MNTILRFMYLTMYKEWYTQYTNLQVLEIIITPEPIGSWALSIVRNPKQLENIQFLKLDLLLSLGERSLRKS
jgi:hypothetical protein